MPKVKTVEKQIWDLEGFDVSFRQQGRDVRSDRSGVPAYPFQRSAKNEMTVAEWKKQRFQQHYSGFDVEVLDGSGEEVPGQKKLGTVRDSYEEDD